ncbi:MAG: bacterial Ig-like domain-containing protein [Oscillospiraceae bacterium]|nr:bacterial Ig-like domain-containing protein [Oscillospiraceae bacterium]
MKIRVLWLALAMLMLLSACAGEPVKDTEPPTVPTEPELLRLEIVRMPDKTDYVLGESFDPAGLTLNAVMSDGSVVENVDWSVSEDQVLLTNTTHVPVSYQGKTVQIPVRVRHPGNVDEYAVDNFPTLEDSPLAGKTFFWLGSSVTLGSNSLEESMADFIAKKYDCTCIKEAVSGTTLATYKKDSYVDRLLAWLESEDRPAHVDAVIVQLSTNDQNQPESFGSVTAFDVRDPEAFDTATTFGAMEYIIATVQAELDCPVLFYANPPTERSSYMDMVLGLYEIAVKWDVRVIDMYMDPVFNDLPTQEQRKLWMTDKIHPTKAGYRDWWLPKFEEALLELA